jgi:ribosomal protein L37AE/L43A
LSAERADFCCPDCDDSDIVRVEGTDGTFECRACGARTHEKIEAHREELAALADGDGPAGEVAALLLGGGEE